MPTITNRRPPVTASDPSLNIEKLVTPLLRKSFDLRRAYEEKLRLLTELQHEIDIVRSAGTPFPRRRQGLENIELHFRDLAKATGNAADLLKKVRAEFDEIHHEIHTNEKRQLER